MQYHDVTWIASAITDEDRLAAGETRDETARDGSPYRFVSSSTIRRRTTGTTTSIANPMLWFVQHSLWELAYTPKVDAAFHRAWDEGYVAVNANVREGGRGRARCGRRTPRCSSTTTTCTSRRGSCAIARPDAALMHFVHIPWPQPDYWRVFPSEPRCAIHDGLIANDVIGFHTERWRRNFIYSVRELLGEDDHREDHRRADLRGHGRVRGARAEPRQCCRAEREIIATRPEQLIVRVDRTDPSKNIVRGFRAFELYLDAHPERHRHVGMLALLDPSRQEIPEYAEYLAAIQREARRVNDRFQQEGWRPIELEIADDFAKSVAAYKQFDVLLVNAIFDGMNLVAKEAPLINERDGVVVLSENTGAHAELGEWALSVNPFDVEGQAEAIAAALSMDAAERHARLEAIRAHVREHDLNRWTDMLLAALDRVVARARG